VVALPKPGKGPKFPHNLRPISRLSTTGKLFQKITQKLIQGHLDVNNLLDANYFGFRARHSTTLQCMRLTDHVTLNFNNNISTAAVFLDIEKAFDTIWHPGLLYILSKLLLSVDLLKLISSYLSHTKFRVLAEGEISTPRQIEVWVPQGSVLAPTLYSLHINDTPQIPGFQLPYFVDDTCMYAT